MASELSRDHLDRLLAGDECLSVRDGHLAVEGVDLGELAGRFGTPLYVVSEGQLRANARAVVAAFSEHWPEGPVLVMPSIKANLSLALRRILTEEGTGCDTFGPGELEAALRSGVEPERISLNGSTKSHELLERAVGAGVRTTLDSLDELDQIRAIARAAGTVARVRFRLRPFLEIEEPTELLADPLPIRIATQVYKPGIPTEQVLSIPRETIEAPELDVSGVMVHIGRQGRDPEIWAELARWLTATIGELSAAWDGWRPREIDLGGGFPIPRDPFAGAERVGEVPRPLAPTLADYARAIAGGLREGLTRAGIDHRDIQLEVEPGRSLYGNAGLHLARVRHVKSQIGPIPYRWVETDTSEIFLADVVFERNRWNAVAVDRVEQPPGQSVDIVGISCNSDVIVAKAQLPEVVAGDVIAFLDTGAYQDANASNFNALPRPGTVLVNGSEAEVIKRADTIADVFSRDRIPRRLSGGRACISIRGLDHVSVSSGDIERSIAFYSGLLGIPVMQSGEAEGPEVREITGLPDAKIRFADLDLGDGRILELLEFVRPAGPALRAELHHPGSGHLSLRTGSADDVHAALVEAGVAVLSKPVELSEPAPWNGARCFYTVDPDGFTVEIIERP